MSLFVLHVHHPASPITPWVPKVRAVFPVLQAYTFRSAPLMSSSGNLVYWGRREFASENELTNFAVNSQTNPVLLYRNQALILYDLQPATGVTLNVDGWAICNQYAYGTVSPFDASAVGVEGDTPYHFDLATYDYVTTLPEAYRIKQRDDDEVATASSVSGDPRYIFENVNAEDDQVYVIMKIQKMGAIGSGIRL